MRVDPLTRCSGKRSSRSSTIRIRRYSACATAARAQLNPLDACLLAAVCGPRCCSNAVVGSIDEHRRDRLRRVVRTAAWLLYKHGECRQSDLVADPRSGYDHRSLFRGAPAAVGWILRRVLRRSRTSCVTAIVSHDRLQPTASVVAVSAPARTNCELDGVRDEFRRSCRIRVLDVLAELRLDEGSELFFGRVLHVDVAIERSGNSLARGLGADGGLPVNV